MTNYLVIGSKGRMGKKRITELKRLDSKSKIFESDVKGENKDYKKVLLNNNIDSVFVCVPHTKTTDIVIYCLKAGCDVFAEKPPGISLDDVKRMESFINKNILIFGFNHRFLTHIRKAKEILDKKTLGNILYMRGIYGKTTSENWRNNKSLAGRGILLSQGIHMIDLFRYLSNEEFKVMGSSISYSEDEWRENNVMAVLKSENNIDASIHSSSVMGKNIFNMMIGCEKGYIILNGLGCSDTKSFGFPDTIEIGYSNVETFYGHPYKEIYSYGDKSGESSWKEEVDYFINVCKSRGDYMCNIIDSHNIMKLVDDIYEK